MYDLVGEVRKGDGNPYFNSVGDNLVKLLGGGEFSTGLGTLVALWFKMSSMENPVLLLVVGWGMCRLLAGIGRSSPGGKARGRLLGRAIAAAV